MGEALWWAIDDCSPHTERKTSFCSTASAFMHICAQFLSSQWERWRERLTRRGEKGEGENTEQSGYVNSRTALTRNTHRPSVAYLYSPSLLGAIIQNWQRKHGYIQNKFLFLFLVSLEWNISLSHAQEKNANLCMRTSREYLSSFLLGAP